MKHFIKELKTKALLGICLLLAFTMASAQEARIETISIRFLDADTGQPVEGLVLTEYPISSGTTEDIPRIFMTDALGEITFNKVIKGFLIESDIYEENILDVSTIQPDQIFSISLSNHLLQGASVEAYWKADQYKEIPAAVSTLNPRELNRDQQASLQTQFNALPGVQMESRGYGGSRRLSIRGSFIRSPFAVRNIKMYLDGIPFTSPDGSSPFEMIDPSDLAQVTIVKGPVGGLYGSGNGGAILFSTKKAIAEATKIDHTTSAGSFGFTRTATQIGAGFGKWNIYASNVYQETDGYRDQEWNWKHQRMLRLEHQTTDRFSWRLNAINYHGRWGLPGSIKWEDLTEDPTQANANSELLNAHVRRNRQWVGLTTRYQGFKWSNETSVYGTITDKNNNYGTSPFFKGIKEEKGLGYGGRTEFNMKFGFDRMNQPENINLFKVKFGLEYQVDDNRVDEFDNDNGILGDFEYRNETRSLNTLLFSDFQYTRVISPHKKLIVEGGLTWQQLIYDNTGLSALDLVFDTERNFDAILPRIGASWNNLNQSVYTNFSMGNSPPSIFEIVDVSNGQFSESLNPEDAWNFEIGYRGNVLNHRLRMDISVYTMELTNAIFPKTDTTGLTLFVNEGVTRSYGAEAQIQAILLHAKSESNSLQRISYVGAFTYQDQSFRNVPFEEEFIEETQVPGVQPWRVNQTLNLQTKFGLEWILQHQWVDAVPIDNANEVFSPAYHRLNTRLLYRFPFKNKDLNLSVFAGINNLTNARYVDFLQVNGVFGRLYNPAPEQNYYGGLRLRWIIEHKS